MTASSSRTKDTSRSRNSASCRSRLLPSLRTGHVVPAPAEPDPPDAARAPRNLCPTRRSPSRARLQPLARPTIRGAGSAACCCTNCCATCRPCPPRSAPLPPVTSWRSRRMTSRRRMSNAGPTRRWPSPEAPEHAALFAEGSRAEVPLIGTVRTSRGTFTVSGQVDRLAVSETEVLIVDFKTNRPPPQSADGVTLAYRRQLALYRALLQGIYPGRTRACISCCGQRPRARWRSAAETLDNSMPYAARHLDLQAPRS